MISAFVRAGFVLNDADYTDRARQAANFILARMLAEGRLNGSYKDGAAAGFTAGSPARLKKLLSGCLAADM